ncbi:MAG: hypothetical protein ABIO92_10975 [Chloroflexia bacterium]
MDKQRQPNSSSLFLVRLWVDEAGEEEKWRGRLVHVLSGQAHDFRDWPNLSRLLMEMMPGPDAKPSQETHDG